MTAVKKLLSGIVIILFIFTDTAFALRIPLGIKRGQDVGYKLIADWIRKELGYGVKNGKAKKDIINELKRGKVIIERDIFLSENNFEGIMGISINFRRGCVIVKRNGKARNAKDLIEFSWHKVNDIRVKEIPINIRALFSKTTGMKTYEWTISYGAHIGPREFLFGPYDNRYIGLCLSSLGEDAPLDWLYKKLIEKKLKKLQRSRSDFAEMIREKSLELLEIDEKNFREPLVPFIKDYILIRDNIREQGAKDDTMYFFNKFDQMITTEKLDGNGLPIALYRQGVLRFENPLTLLTTIHLSQQYDKRTDL